MRDDVAGPDGSALSEDDLDQVAEVLIRSSRREDARAMRDPKRHRHA